jgi:chromosome segregation ATPase
MQRHRRKEEDPQAGLPETPFVKRIWETIEEIKATEDLLVKLEQDSQLQFLEMELETNKASLLEVTNGIVSANNALAQKKTQHAELERQLVKIPPKIELLKALVEELLVTMTIEELREKGSQLILKSEVENLNYFAVQRQMAEMAAEIEGIASRAEYYEKEKIRLKDEVTSGSAKITEAQEAKKGLLEALEANQATFKVLRDEYQKDRNQMETLENEIQKARTLQKAAEDEIETLKTKIKGLESTLFTNRQMLDAKQRRIKDLIKARNDVALPSQEVSHLMDYARNVSRSGATILFRAAVNPQKVGPDRAKTVLAGMMMGLIGICFLLVGVRLIREN